MSSNELKQFYHSKNWEILDRMKGRTGQRFLIASSRGSTADREERYFFAGRIDEPDASFVILAFSVSGTALACEHVQKLVGRNAEAFLLQGGLLRIQEALLEDESPRKVSIDLHSRSLPEEFRITSTAKLKSERDRAILEMLTLLAEKQYRGNDAETSHDELLDTICVSDAVFNRVQDILLQRGWIEVTDLDGSTLITPDGEDELARLQQRTPPMPISSVATDKIDILKQDNTRHSGLKASVQNSRIFMDHTTFPVETGDLVERNMSNSVKETYRVLDPGFHEDFHGIKAHYQMHVQNLGVPEAAKAVATIINNYNLNGPNARINNNSTDASTNIVHTDARAIQYVQELRTHIKSASLSDEEKNEALAALDDVEVEVKSPTPRKRVISALLNQLPNVESAANIAAMLIALFGK